MQIVIPAERVGGETRVAATPETVKAKYKTLVKRLHPDANGGSRDNEDTLKAVIHAYDTLRSSGFC